MPNGSPARCASCGEWTTSSRRGRPLPYVSTTTGYRMRIGLCWIALATALRQFAASARAGSRPDAMETQPPAVGRVRHLSPQAERERLRRSAIEVVESREGRPARDYPGSARRLGEARARRLPARRFRRARLRCRSRSRRRAGTWWTFPRRSRTHHQRDGRAVSHPRRNARHLQPRARPRRQHAPRRAPPPTTAGRVREPSEEDL
jgi:hypothetical protein